VLTKNDNQLFGMRRFSLHHPKIRTFQIESLFLETLRYYDVLAPRSQYVNVVINGDEIGIMQMEEHFSKELVEQQKRREGVIVKFNEDYVLKTQFDPTYDNYKNAYIDAFQSSKIQRTPALKQQYDTAVGLLRGFTHGYLKPSEVFDEQCLGFYLAVTQLWGVGHAASWRNIRFYLNPITLRLEPIGFDSEIYARTRAGDVTFIQNPIPIDMLSDSLIEQAYLKAVKRLTKDIQKGRLIQHLKQFETPALKDLHNEFVFLDPFGFEDLITRVEQIPMPKAVASTEPIVPKYDIDFTQRAPKVRFPKSLHLYTIRKNGKHYLDLASMTPNEMDITNIRWVDPQQNTSFEFTSDSTITYPISLRPTPPGSTPVSTFVPYTPLDLPEAQIEVTAILPGTEFQVVESVLPYAEPLDRPPLPMSTLLTSASIPPYLSINRQDRVVTIKKGIWEIPSLLVIPDHFRLVISAGTTLKFGQEAGLFVPGPMDCQGTSDAPIVMEGISRAEVKGNWMGIFVKQAQTTSLWHHVQIYNTSGMRYNEWSLTGGVTFYRSDVTMQDGMFEGHQGEDALNIIHSKFEMANVEIAQTASDGFDADFSEGTISGGRFKLIGQVSGGDAVDISGSTVTVDGTIFQQVTDKALSVGERSHMIVRNVVIEQAVAGAVSKDDSMIELYDVSFDHISLASMMAYIKKEEYGPAHIKAQGVTIQGDSLPAIVQTNSRIELNGAEIPTRNVDVDQLYLSVMKKKTF